MLGFSRFRKIRYYLLGYSLVLASVFLFKLMVQGFMAENENARLVDFVKALSLEFQESSVEGVLSQRLGENPNIRGENYSFGLLDESFQTVEWFGNEQAAPPYPETALPFSGLREIPLEFFPSLNLALKKILIQDRGFYLAALKNPGSYEKLVFWMNVSLVFFAAFLLFVFYRLYHLANRKNLLPSGGSEATGDTPIPDTLKIFGNSLHEGLLLINSEFEILYANQTTRNYLKLKLSEEKKNFLDEQVRNTEVINLIESFFKSYQRKKELIVLNLDKKKYFEFDCMPLPSLRDREIGLISIWDATFYQNVNNSHREFVANVSHELKTPVTNILGYSETLMESPDLEPETIREMSAIIHEQSLDMKNIIEVLRKISKLENELEAVSISLSEITLDKLIEKAIKSHQPNLERKKIEMVFQPNPEIRLNTKPDLVFHVLSNILENAVKFSEAGKKISVQTLQRENEVVVSVKDEGQGIPSKDIPFIFDAFYTGENNDAENSKGAGLGLSLVKKCLEHLNGRIDVKSLPKIGTEFTVHLPHLPSPSKTS